MLDFAPYSPHFHTHLVVGEREHEKQNTKKSQGLLCDSDVDDEPDNRKNTQRGQQKRNTTAAAKN